MNLKKIIFETKKRIAKLLFNNRCFVCWKKFGKRFAYHHKYYTQGGLTYKSGDPQYALNILKEVEAHPEQFALLCVKHHFMIEFLKKFKLDSLVRLVILTIQSRQDGGALKTKLVSEISKMPVIFVVCMYISYICIHQNFFSFFIFHFPILVV